MSNSQLELPQGRYGLHLENHDINDKKIKIEKIKPLKDVTLQEHFPPVWDQNGRATSTAQAIAAVIEYEQVRKGLRVTPISRIYLQLLGRGGIRKTLKMVNKQGAIAEKLLPYDMMPPYPELESLRERDRMYIGHLEYTRVPSDIDVVKMVLSTGIPIIFGYDIYESFHKRGLWNNDGLMPLPKKGERYLATHTGVILGYSRKKKAVIVRNSWGPQWKNGGHFFLPYSYLMSKSCGTLWTLDIKKEQFFENVVEGSREKASRAPVSESESESEPGDVTIDLDGCKIVE